ncbi:hypothetical protein [Thermococcus sp. MAR1]|uniref:hypothetical protein n=1 Tax=Thermococcus sp. MAR1 TaxID=1638263 RepID=UPI0016B379AC|nr:hypothetical protein [Thermococcus sp. MAR1]NJE11432.1 hypothetical protein [Thermococcus sp. MAR1]
MARASSLIAPLTFLTFFGAGFLMVVSFFVVDSLGSVIPFADGFSMVLSLLILLPLTKHLFISIGVEDGNAGKLALLVGLLAVLVFYVTIPRACGWCR